MGELSVPPRVWGDIVVCPEEKCGISGNSQVLVRLPQARCRTDLGRRPVRFSHDFLKSRASKVFGYSINKET